MKLVEMTNKVALVMVMLLIYWVFIFVASSVFGFKIFRENMTEIFLMSIFGIFSILVGSIILNIMFNLTAIASRNNVQEKEISKPIIYKWIALFFLSLLVIFSLLYYGDSINSQKKKDYLLLSAHNLVNEQNKSIERIADYSFSREYINKTCQDIKIISKTEEKFPQVTLILRDSIDNRPVLLAFNDYCGLGKDEEPTKSNYIVSTSSEERAYLNNIFDGLSVENRFSSHDGRYEIYYPVKTSHGVIVLHLSQYSRYGKAGS